MSNVVNDFHNFRAVSIYILDVYSREKSKNVYLSVLFQFLMKIAFDGILKGILDPTSANLVPI